MKNNSINPIFTKKVTISIFHIVIDIKNPESQDNTFRQCIKNTKWTSGHHTSIVNSSIPTEARTIVL